MSAPRREDGQVLLLSIGYAVLALLLVTAAVCATSVHLQRKRLLALADLAALSAADSLDRAAYFSGEISEDDSLVLLIPSTVRATTEQHLRTSPEAQRFSDLEILRATTTDGRTAVVTLRATAELPLISAVTAPWSDGIRLEVTARARAG